MSVIDPMADIASIVDDAVAAGLDPRRLAFACVYMKDLPNGMRGNEPRAPRRCRGRSLPTAPWTDTCCACHAKLYPTSRELNRLRSDALLFASTTGADWLSASIEDPQSAPTAWQTLTASETETLTLPQQRAPLLVEADSQVEQMQRGGTA